MSLKGHVALAGGLGAACGAMVALGGLDDDVGVAVTTTLGVGLVGGIGAAAGVAQAGVWKILSRSSRSLGLQAWWVIASSRDAADRKPAIALHASAVAAALAVAGFGLLLWFVLPRLFHVDDPAFARGFGLMLLTLALVSSAIGAVILGRILIALFRRLDDRVRLPWPAAPALQLFLWVTVPTLACTVPYLLRHHKDLGTFAAPFWVVNFLLVEANIALTWGYIARARPSWNSRLQSLVIIAIMTSLMAGIWAAARSPDVGAWTRRRTLVGRAADLYRFATDFDRDGYSAWLGGGDCAPFDGSLSPGARDVPGNGVDENCDGEDADPASAEQLARISGVLPEDARRNFNVVLVIVDAMRADHTSVGGYKKVTTPYLDALAEESLVFTKAYSQSSATMLSIPSLLAGRDPSGMDWVAAERIEPARTETPLALRLKSRGYNTGIVAVTYFAKFLERIKEPYDKTAMIVDQKGTKSQWFTGRAGPIVAAAIRQVEELLAEESPFFLTVYIPDPHSPYDLHPFGISEFGSKTLGRYDGEIANSDRQIGFLIQYLKYMDLWEDTVVIVTSDHGEEFQEHGGKTHARTCYVESTHVPLVVRIPGIEPQKIDRPVGLLDVTPTVLEIVGETAEIERMHGQSLLIPALAPALAPDDRLLSCAVVSQRASQGNYFVRAVRSKKWLLVHHVLDGAYELYDTLADPKEERDLYSSQAEEPDVVRLRDHLNSTLTGNLQRNLLTD